MSDEERATPPMVWTGIDPQGVEFEFMGRLVFVEPDRSYYEDDISRMPRHEWVRLEILPGETGDLYTVKLPPFARARHRMPGKPRQPKHRLDTDD